jgi:hypothetical protein
LTAEDVMTTRELCREKGRDVGQRGRREERGVSRERS